MAIISLILALSSSCVSLRRSFRASDLPLLCRWSELTVMIDQARGELAVSGMVTADGKVSPWFSIYQQSVKALSGLALRLRFGPQSRTPKAPENEARGGLLLRPHDP